MTDTNPENRLENLWDAATAASMSESEKLLYRSNLLGSDKRVTNYGGGPVGADTLAAALSEERDTIEEVIEPFLLKLGFLQRTPRGRVISDLGCQYLGVPSLRKNVKQFDLLDLAGD